MIFPKFLILTFIEMSDQLPIISRSIISKYKNKLSNRQAINFN